jgi:hypothetical protein
MGFDSSGTFSRIASGGGGISDGVGSTVWQGDAAAGTKIRADRHDSHDQDLANGLTECLTRTGKGVPAVDIPWGGKKIINLQNPSAPQDAATKDYVDNPGPSTKSRDLAGADVDGRLNFTALTGVNGITWSSINASWVAKKADASGQKERDRLVLNNSASTTGVDVFGIDDNDGALQFPSQFQAYTNLVFDGVSYRTPAVGIGGVMRKTATALSMLANSVATTLAYGVATLEEWFNVTRIGGTVVATFNKKAATDYAGLAGSMNGKLRWLEQLGSGHAESSGDVGSNYYLTCYTDAGASKYTVMWGARSDGRVRLPQGLSGQINMDNHLSFDTAGVVEAGTTMVIAAGSTIYLRPQGASNGAGQALYSTVGDLAIDRYMNARGYIERAGTADASSGGQYFNFDYVGGSGPLHAWVNTADLGAVAFTCDYRLKKDVKPLERTWDKVKALRPVSFSRRDWVIHEGEGVGRETWLSRDSNEIEWGFVAHELQETLLPSAANGHKDQEDVVQSPNLPAIIAALTSALQEAMARIEALEARA